MIVLGIETSCDETAAAVVSSEREILSESIYSQIKTHEEYLGVVPELAARSHIDHCSTVVKDAINKANLSISQVDAIAATAGPGLLGGLLVGLTTAKAISLAAKKPFIAINHLDGHALTPRLSHSLEFPYLLLLISGGHSMFLAVEGPGKYKLLGQSIDDALGEAFDKSAKILGLEYPGGPLIDKYAKKGNPEAFKFTKPRVGDLEFSFSGLKSNILQVIQRESKKNPDFIKDNLYDLCASIQHTIISILLEKIDNAVKKTGITQIAIAGGVSANSGLRNALLEREKTHKWCVFIPKFEYCTDNAAMIAISGYYKFHDEQFTNSSVSANSRMKL